MNTIHQSTFTKNTDNNTVTVERKFDAAPELVWRAWTDKELLDQWWAPQPWKAETKSQDFRPGGKWIYAMKGPDGEASWAIAEYETITPITQYTGTDAFSDENGNINTEFPRMHWKVDFAPSGSGTQVTVLITFSSEADMQKIMEMGFKEGFEMAHGNLDELLAKA